MIEKCVLCNSNKDIQEHHISYFPEIKVYLRKKCHKEEHKNIHGTGPSKGSIGSNGYDPNNNILKKFQLRIMNNRINKSKNDIVLDCKPIGNRVIRKVGVKGNSEFAIGLPKKMNPQKLCDEKKRISILQFETPKVEKLILFCAPNNDINKKLYCDD